MFDFTDFTPEEYESLEKEAKSYVNAAFCRVKAGLEEISIEAAMQTFIDGAELGYIKALGNIKANRWQYPSRGELPKCDEETQLIFYVNCYYEVGGETLTRKRMVLGYYKKSFLRDDDKLFVEKSKGYEEEHLPQAVIAWKEIEPPEEVE